MMSSLKDRLSKSRVTTVRFGDREIVAEGLRLNFWADISHRCMTASWPSFVGGAVAIFVIFNALFGLLYWLGDDPISNVTHSDYIDYLYFSIETLSTAGYGDMHPQTHYGHFIAAIELFTGIFSMSVMTGLIFSRFSRPSARLLFANNPTISAYEGKPTLTLRLANERHNFIANATARLWVFKNVVSPEGEFLRRFGELSLVKNEHPALALTWTLYHILDETSPLYNMSAEDMEAVNVAFIVSVSGYDAVAAQTIHARKSYDHSDIRFGQRYVDILESSDNKRVRIDYGKFHDTENA
jgi:inward rectifier potassium channel